MPQGKRLAPSDGGQRRRRRGNDNRLMLSRLALLAALVVLIVVGIASCHAIVSTVSNRGQSDASQGSSVVSSDSSSLTQSDAEVVYKGTLAPAIEKPSKVPETYTFNLIMVGDILLHNELNLSGEQADGTYNYDHFFAHTSDIISAADLAIVNQEVILGGLELGLSGYPLFNTAYEVGDALVAAGFDVVCHATNHALDKGSTGLLNCLNFWETSYPDIEVLGIHDSQESRDTLHLIEYEGITIALLNYTYGTNGISLPASYMVDLLDEEQVVADLQRANEVADFIIVIPHWGTEYSLTVSSQQEEWVQIFLENGVDLVLGAHPHVIEPVEWVEDDEGNSMLVYYSLGNFIEFPLDTGNGKRALGIMADVTLTIQGDSVTISDYGVIPVIAHMVSGTGNPTVYPLSEYTEELWEENELSTRDPSCTLEYCRELCRSVFGDLYEE